jgi:hypothetical protein
MPAIKPSAAEQAHQSKYKFSEKQRKDISGTLVLLLSLIAFNKTTIPTATPSFPDLPADIMSLVKSAQFSSSITVRA